MVLLVSNCDSSTNQGEHLSGKSRCHRATQALPVLLRRVILCVSIGVVSIFPSHFGVVMYWMPHGTLTTC